MGEMADYANETGHLEEIHHLWILENYLTNPHAAERFYEELEGAWPEWYKPEIEDPEYLKNELVRCTGVLDKIEVDRLRIKNEELKEINLRDRALYLYGLVKEKVKNKKFYCPKCKSKIILKTNRTTKMEFLGCSGFPICKWSFSMEQ